MPVNPTGSALLGLASEYHEIDLVMSRYRHSANYHQPRYMAMKKYYDLFRGIVSRRHPAAYNNVHVPFALSILESDVSRKVQALFSSWPIVEFSGYSPEDGPSAKRNEVLISAQMKDARSFSKAVDFFTSADIYGTAFARVGWTTKAELESYREPNLILGKEEILTREVVTFDGPDWEVMDILNCFPQPEVKFIDDMAYFIIRYHLDLDELERRAQMGVYDMAGVHELMKAPPANEAEGAIIERPTFYRSMYGQQARTEESFAKPIEIIEYWGVVPKEFAKDGIVNRVISVGNGRVKLRNRAFPFWIKKKPFFAYSPMPDPHFLWGIGKIEPIARLNMSANKLASIKADVFEMFANPVWITSAQAGLDKENLYMRAGRVFQTDAPEVSDAHIRPLIPDLRGVQGAFQEIEQLWRWSQQATGIIEDTVMGGRGQSRETATGFQGRQEGVVNRLTLEAMLAGEMFVEPLANYMRALNRQFLKLPHMVKILGTGATTNPITGYPLPMEPTTINHDDVNQDYDARAVGMIYMLGRGLRRQDMMALTQVVGQNPAFVQLINWSGWLHELLSTFEMNAQELTNTAPTALNVAAGAQGGEAGGIAAPFSLDNLGG